MKTLVFGALFIALITGWTQPWKLKEVPERTTGSAAAESAQKTGDADIGAEKEMAFSDIGLKTNTAIASIDLKNVLGGGPRKDGIPAIHEPEFLNIVESDWLDDEGLGILYQNGSEIRFYPYAILYWHEIVNDTVEGRPVSVTFCPLCGSAIVFDRRVEGDILSFGVSGKLWESNLLMYDTQTETLWSQIRGEAVVGDRTGQTLSVLPSSVLSFAQVKEHFPKARVLSKNTGHIRAYGNSPYGDYEENNSLYFPVSESDAAFHKKEIFVIAPFRDKTVGFMWKKLREKGRAEINVDGSPITATYTEEGTVEVNADRKKLPTYNAMWFSWVTHVSKERVVWPGKN